MAKGGHPTSNQASACLLGLGTQQTEFYHSSSAVVNGKIQYTLFGESDPEAHARMKRPVAKYFATGAVLTLEPHIDRAIVEFCKQLNKRFVSAPDGPKTFDLLEWVMYCRCPDTSPSLYNAILTMTQWPGTLAVQPSLVADSGTSIRGVTLTAAFPCRKKSAAISSRSPNFPPWIFSLTRTR